MESDFYRFAENIRTETENAIKSGLSRMSFFERLGFGIFMPLIVNFVTDQGVMSLSIQKDGTIQLGRLLSSSPDNTIKTSFEMLKDLYYSRNKNRFDKAEKDGRIEIVGHTWKGQQAERKLRELLSS